MSKILTDELAERFSLKGHKGKKDFSKLKLNDVVIGKWVQFNIVSKYNIV